MPFSILLCEFLIIFQKPLLPVFFLLLLLQFHWPMLLYCMTPVPLLRLCVNYSSNSDKFADDDQNNFSLNTTCRTTYFGISISPFLFLTHQSTTPLQATGYVTLAAFVKYPCKHGYFPHCSRKSKKFLKKFVSFSDIIQIMHINKIAILHKAIPI